MTETKAPYKTTLPDKALDRSVKGKAMTPMVKAIGEMSFTGNIIPHTWFSTIRRENDKPDLAAIIILSDVVYWYRPKEVRNETTGALVRHERKFKADKLQRSYQQLATMFGISKRQAADACKRLRDLGVITLELRNIKLESGLCLSNVLYIEPVPDALYAVTFPSQEVLQKTGTPVTENGNTLLQKTGTPVTENGKTYTETTTEISTETTTTPDVVENLLALRELGVMANEHTVKIASLPHVTPEVIRAVADRLRNDRTTRNLAGRLLDALERGDISPGRGQHTEAELEAARNEALAEEPIDVTTFLEQ